MGFCGKLLSKIRASLFVFKKAEILKNIVNKEMEGEYDNLCHSCYFNERYHEQAELKGIYPDNSKLNISIYLGGALGDYIVYLRFVDEISTICDCAVDLFLDRMEFAAYVYGKRQNVTIIHDAANCLFLGSVGQYDLAVHLDHGVTLKGCKLGAIREKAPEFYVTACKIVEFCKKNQIDNPNQSERECVLLRRARILGETKWSKLSCGGAIDMREMYSNLWLDSQSLYALDRYQIRNKKYITINFGADKNMGGTAQTKVLPADTLQMLVQKFKQKYPDFLVVQTGVRDSMKIPGADRYAFECKLDETAIILKYSTCHIDSEGGLVHMASQLSTPCVVSFGPTPVYYYGYPRNKNIVSSVCSDCMATTSQWSRVCPRGMQVPACMKSIKSDELLGAIEEILEESSIAKSQIIIPSNAESDVWQTTKQYLEKTEAVNICIVAALDNKIAEQAVQMKKMGKCVTIFIPVKVDDQVVKLRTALKKDGIAVEYGSPINIARQNDSFDLLYCQKDEATEQEHHYSEKECARLLKNNGVLVWMENK